MTARMVLLFFAGLLLCFGAACTDRETPRQVSLEEKEVVPLPATTGNDALRVAVGGMITPREGFAYYRQFLDYLGARLGKEVRFIDRESYAEINELIRTEQVDVAFVCGGPYVSGHAEFGMELLAAPRAYGDTVYYSYIIVPLQSPAQRFEDLRGRRFAFTDPLSNTGKLVPTYMLARMGESPESFFAESVYTGSHDRAIEAVARGLVDGAAVDSLIWEYARVSNPRLAGRTRILRKSPPYGIPPVVVRPGLPQELKEEIRRVFLSAHEDGEGGAILARMMIERFVPIDDAAYDSIREMMAWVEAHGQEKR